MGFSDRLEEFCRQAKQFARGPWHLSYHFYRFDPAANRNLRVSGNRLTDTSDDGGFAGVYIYAGSADTQITGNRVSGFAYPVDDDSGSADNLIKGNPSPS